MFRGSEGERIFWHRNRRGTTFSQILAIYCAVKVAHARVQFHWGEVFLNVNAISRCRAERKRDSHSHVFAAASISRCVFPRSERDEYLDLYTQGDGKKGVALLWIRMDYGLIVWKCLMLEL